jgi:nitrite reductase/ring-hydroxylating ferredoxin subunit
MGMRLAPAAPMSAMIRVASIAELPPGKGKIVEVGSRRITVFNCEGRFHATQAGRGAPVLDTTATCPAHGLAFDVYMEDSPARRHDEADCLVRVDDEGVWLIVG